MNRSFRAPERGMQPAMAKQRRQMKEKEEELALFLEMRKREKERINLLIHNSDEFDAPMGLTTGSSPIFDIASATPAPVRKTAADEFLNSENDKNDYEWLLTPPGTPLFPSLEMESQKTIMSETGSPKAHPTALRSRLANPQLEPIAMTNLALRQSASSPGLHTSNGSNGIVHRPSSSGGPGSRPATPTGRPTLTSSSKPTLNSASKPMLTTVHKSSSYTASKPSSPAASKPSSTIASKPSYTIASKPPYTTASKPSSTIASRPSCSSTPTSHATLTTTKATVPARSSTPTPRSTPRSSTPTSRSNARASTPTARASVPASKPTSTRATTPIRRPTTTLSNAPNLSAPPVKSPSASVPKVTPATARNPAPLRPSSPTVKSRPWKPTEMPGFSLDAPPNLRTSLSDRPTSASRGRPGAPSIRSASVGPAPNGRIKRQSCSPSRGRPPNGFNINSGGSVPALNRAYAKATDNVSPVMYGTKMVERVINMRKLVPPRQDDKHSPLSNLSGKSSSPDSSGFGRTLSKKSLDMAIRHMDIRRSIPGNLRPLMTNIPASSMYSVRSGPPPRGRVVNVSDSPLATSSNASSEVSVNNNSLCLDRIELEDNTNSERGVQSPANIRGR